MVKNIDIETIDTFGGSLCLDFINTVHGRKETPIRDYLFNIIDLITWAVKLEVIKANRGKLLEKVALSQPNNGEDFFHYSISLRELLHRVFINISNGVDIAAEDLLQFNVELSRHQKYFKLGGQIGCYIELQDIATTNFLSITSPIIKDAYSLILRNKHEKIKECPACGWVFIDTSKNGKRRWCNMKICGSNVKALDWYHRHKKI